MAVACPNPQPNRAPAAGRENIAPNYVETRPFLTSESDYYVADSFVGHLHKPNARRHFDWAEHPKGEIDFLTNNLGFREDRDTAITGREGTVTILVTGDSHTDGVVWNSESFPNLLEAGLSKRSASLRYDVVNGGVGYYGPYNYTRWVEKYAFLKPALAIVTIYVGNDFLDSCRVLEGAGLANPRGESYYSRINGLPTALRSVAGQCLNQAYYFSVFPAMEKPALDYTERELLELSGFCQQRGVELLVLLLPDKLEAEQDQGAIGEAAAALGVNPEKVLVGRRLAAQLAQRLEHDSVAVVDLEPALAGRHGYFWEADHHLSVAGHRRVAEFLLDHQGPRFDHLAPSRN